MHQLESHCRPRNTNYANSGGFLEFRFTLSGRMSFQTLFICSSCMVAYSNHSKFVKDFTKKTFKMNRFFNENVKQTATKGIFNMVS